MFNSFVKLIMSIPGVKQVIGTLILVSMGGFILKIGLNYTSSHYNVWTTNQTNDIITFSLMLSLFFVSFWTIGQKIFQYLFLKSLFSTILYLMVSSLNYYVIKSKAVIDWKMFAYCYAFVVVVPILRWIVKYFSRPNLGALNKTMTEIDNFGVTNGKKETKLAGDIFERYIRDLYRAMGYDAHVAFDLKAQGKAPEGLQNLSGDGGADVIAEDKKNGHRLVIQCKHYSNTVGVEACYQAAGALNNYQGTQAIVITNNFFTEEAKFNAKNNNIILIDRFQLTKMIAEVSKVKEKQQPKNLFKNQNNNKVA